MASVPFNNLITFSRGSNATVTGSNGLIQWAPNNLLTNSEQFDNAAWSKTAVAVTANSTTSPDGTATADTITDSVTTAAFRVSQAQTTAASAHTASIFAKQGTASWLRVLIDGTSTGSLNAYFNLSDGTVGTVSAGLTATITSFGNGWYRCTATATMTAASNRVYYQLCTADNQASMTGTGSNTIQIWGAQLELGSAATTYNSTTVKNLLGFSEAFDNAAWTKTRASIVTGAQANPVNGAFNAQKLMEDTTASNTHRILSSTVTVATGNPVTVSVYLKAAGRTWCRIADGGVTNSGAYVDLATGQFGTISSGVTRSSIVAAGNGWYRVSITGVLVGSLSQLLIDLATGDNSGAYTGDGNSGVYIYGAQLSDSASLDPYVPTPAAAPSSTAYYGPRFDYDPVTLAPKGLLVEEARTNNLLYSEQFDNAYWSTNFATITPNNTVSPDGTVNADLITETAVNGEHRIFRLSSLPLGSQSNVTQSLFFKPNGRNFITVIPQDSLTTPRVTINVTTGAYSINNPFGAGAALISASSTPYQNGWYRVVVAWTTSTTPVAVNTFFQLSDAITTGGAYLGNGTSGAWIYGAQLEAGAFATSYIPTVASTVTRSADIATINGSLFSQWYGQSEGTFVLNADVSSSSGFSFVGLSAHTPGGTSNNRVLDITSAVARTYVYASGTLTGAMLSLGSVTPNVPFKQATAYASATNNAVLNGASAQTAAVSPNPTTITVLGIGVRQDGTVYSAGHIRSIDFIPARAADFQLQALTL